MVEELKDVDIFFAESKSASVALVKDPSWSYWWLDMPAKNKCLVAEYVPEDYPHFRVFVTSNDKAVEMIADLKTHGWVEAGMRM